MPATKRKTAWVPSVFCAETVIRCELRRAWPLLPRYEIWNPAFVGAKVTPGSGGIHGPKASSC